MLQNIAQNNASVPHNGSEKTEIPGEWEAAYTISDDITRVRKDGKWYFADKFGTFSLHCNMTVEDYYGLPAYMSVHDIEGMIRNAIQGYQRKMLDDDDIVRCLYALSDSFSWNTEYMDLSCCLREELEAFVFGLWESDNNCLNGQLLLKTILDFGLQKSYETIMCSRMDPGRYDAETKRLLEDVLAVNGMDIQNHDFIAYNADSPF